MCSNHENGLLMRTYATVQHYYVSVHLAQGTVSAYIISILFVLKCWIVCSCNKNRQTSNAYNSES